MASEADLDPLRRDLADALMRGDAGLAEMVAVDAVAGGVPVVEVYDRVLRPALQEMGQRWQQGEASVADEHLATGIVQGILRLLARTSGARPQRTRERVMLAGLATEGHVVGLQMIADLAEARGFDVRYLGAAVPVETLGAIVARHRPDVVGLSSTMAVAESTVEAAVQEIMVAGPPRAVLLGGSGVPPRLRDDPRVRYGPDAATALAILEEVAETPPGSA